MVRPNKEDLFVDAYFENDYNGTEAALTAFDIGSKGGSKSEAEKRATARSMAAEYLAKPSVQQKLKQRLYQDEISESWLMRMYKTKIENGENEQVVRDLMRDIARIHGIDIEKETTPTQVNPQTQGVHVILNVPAPPDGSTSA